MRKWVHAALLVAMILPLYGSGQSDPEKACTVEEGRLIFTLDIRWNARQRGQVVKMFDLDSAMVAQALKGDPLTASTGTTWSVKKLDANLVELSKPLQSVAGGSYGPRDVTLLDDKWMGAEGAATRVSEPYGMNYFTRFEAFNYRNGIAQFFLRGNLKAKEVVLAGSFNDWSTTGTPMQKVDSGWILQVKLKPGKYEYKYIVDGRWTPDPYNRQGVDDTYGDHNSILFCYNHIFYLRGHQDAKSVTVTGSFNGWNERELRMQRVPGGWIRNMYLREGTHAYKFRVDGQWVFDPANKIIRPDGSGNKNNFVSIGDTFYFRLAGHTDAKEVNVAGNFNAWNKSELFMDKVDGGWELAYVLKPGNYEYKFLTDGNWLPDPGNPYTTGSGEYTNSFLPVQPNHLFVLEGSQDAKSVLVSGSFNNWNKSEYRMVKRSGKWTFPIYLNPGKTTYKFVIDGKWITDPGNSLWEKNEYGTGNSVLWIEP